MEINELLKLSIETKASDLIISPGSRPVLRISGDLKPLEDWPVLNPEETQKMIYGLMSKEQIKQFEFLLELDFAASYSDKGVFRVNAYHQAHGIAAAFRVIPSFMPTFDFIRAAPFFKELMKLPNGLILVTGPTACGKSTTLAAMIDYINQHFSRHIITIEDPIEIMHTNNKSLIDQRQVHRDTHDFKNALRSALRENPNVILVGEMRDLETMRLALTAAETGHLVMSTLHTSSAQGAINRIIDVFPSDEKNFIRFMLADSLKAVIYQKLVKRNTGGLIAAFEIMRGTTAIKNLIRENKTAQMYSVMQTGSEEGMQTLDQALRELVNANLISPELLAKNTV